MQITQYLQGMPCWTELAANDASVAKSFYSSLFGWELADIPLPEGAYSMFSFNGEALGAMYGVNDEMHFVVPGWNIYFAVTNLDTVLEALQENGAIVRTGPHQVGEAGRMAMVSDLEGASFCLWEAGNHQGATLFGELNSLCWVELACREDTAALNFYQQALGWQSRNLEMEGMSYTELEQGEIAFGGIMPMTEEWGEVPSHWMPYFRVEDCDLIAARAQELGAEICVTPTEIAGVGRFAVINDPQGAVFSVITLCEPS